VGHGLYVPPHPPVDRRFCEPGLPVGGELVEVLVYDVAAVGADLPVPDRFGQVVHSVPALRGPVGNHVGGGGDGATYGAGHLVGVGAAGLGGVARGDHVLEVGGQGVFVTPQVRQGRILHQAGPPRHQCPALGAHTELGLFAVWVRGGRVARHRGG